MPFYELNLLLRPMPKKEIVDCLKRIATLVWNNDGILRQVQFLGFKKLPYAARGADEGLRYHEGHYFLYHTSMPTIAVKTIRPELKLDTDVLRSFASLANESHVPEDYECTLEEELLTPFYRPSVQPLMTDKNVLTQPRRPHTIQNNKVKLIG